MAAFSDPSFNFQRYLENRPRYPDLLYNTVLDFHKGQRDTVLDIGTGPGLSLFPLAYSFKSLVGADPSDGMVAQADGAWERWKRLQKEKDHRPLVAASARFIVASAEKLSGVADQSVDLIIAATAAHWFDYEPLWPELARVLKPGGTVAFWTYGENYLPAHASLKQYMAKFMSSKSGELGPYWPQPGRRLLESLLVDVPFPAGLGAGKQWDLDSATRVHHKMSPPGVSDISWTRGEAPEETFRMEQIMSFERLNNYFHTSSASAAYFKAHPQEAQEKPDMIERHVAELKSRVLDERRQGKVAFDDGLDDEHVRVAWPLGLMMIRRRVD